MGTQARTLAALLFLASPAMAKSSPVIEQARTQVRRLAQAARSLAESSYYEQCCNKNYTDKNLMHFFEQEPIQSASAAPRGAGHDVSFNLGRGRELAVILRAGQKATRIKATGKSFAQMIAANVPGIVATDLTPDIKDAELQPFLKGLKPGESIDMRHTVGLVDPLTAAERPASEQVNDGLPETLEEVVSYYKGRYYKLKVGGNVAADLDRLTRIAAVLDKGAGDYRCTFDGNEQYDDVDGIVELWRKVEETPALARMVKSTLFIEQPIKRQSALGRPVTALAKYRPVIIDESDGELSTFPEALKLGYAGVSTKNCKGFYKSILNASRVAKLGSGYFMSAEDLTTQPGVSVQQDLALVSLLGLTHVERNAHHFIDGMSTTSEAEQASFLSAHPTLYERSPGKPVRLKIEGGKIDLRSLGCAGFAVGADVDFNALRSMPAAPRERLQ